MSSYRERGAKLISQLHWAHQQGCVSSQLSYWRIRQVFVFVQRNEEHIFLPQTHMEPHNQMMCGNYVTFKCRFVVEMSCSSAACLQALLSQPHPEDPGKTPQRDQSHKCDPEETSRKAEQRQKDTDEEKKKRPVMMNKLDMR